MGDFNDEPADRSVVDHLRASSELDRVIGETNDIDRFKKETADYRATDVFLYNPMWRFLPPENVGTYFLSARAPRISPTVIRFWIRSSSRAAC